MSTFSDSPEPTCDAKVLDWALFILTIISTYVTWWLFPLPTLFKHGFRTYIHDVSWESLRLLVPSFIACKVMLQERPHWQMSYYSGVIKPSTRLEDLKALVKDSFILVSTALALYRLCRGGQADKDLSGLNSSLWNYPSLPVVILGLSIFVFSRTQVKKWIIYLITLIVILAIGATMSVIIELTHGHGVFMPSLVILIYMALPLWALGRHILLLTAALSSIARVAGPIIGATTPTAYFPFCALKGWKFAAPLLVLAIINGLLAMYGTRLTPRVEPIAVPTDEEMVEK